MSNLIRMILGIMVVVFVLSIMFSFLFKVGVLLLIGLGVLYLFKRVFGSST